MIDNKIEPNFREVTWAAAAGADAKVKAAIALLIEFLSEGKHVEKLNDAIGLAEDARATRVAVNALVDQVIGGKA